MFLAARRGSFAYCVISFTIRFNTSIDIYSHRAVIYLEVIFGDYLHMFVVSEHGRGNDSSCCAQYSNTGPHSRVLVYMENCNLLHILLIFTETEAVSGHAVA
jgi:hypothetical protein